jgi:alpha-tubulin suppressor-like RCC1 family protein
MNRLRHLLLLLPTLLMGCQGLFEDPDSEILRNSAVSPVEVAGNRTWSSVSAGSNHTCALSTEGDAYCWGDNEYLQTGSMVDEACASGARCVRTPTAVSGGHQFVQIAAGGSMSCGLTPACAVWCSSQPLVETANVYRHRERRNLCPRDLRLGASVRRMRLSGPIRPSSRLT